MGIRINYCYGNDVYDCLLIVADMGLISDNG